MRLTEKQINDFISFLALYSILFCRGNICESDAIQISDLVKILKFYNFEEEE